MILSSKKMKPIAETPECFEREDRDTTARLVVRGSQKFECQLYRQLIAEYLLHTITISDHDEARLICQHWVDTGIAP